MSYKPITTVLLWNLYIHKVENALYIMLWFVLFECKKNEMVVTSMMREAIIFVTYLEDNYM